MKLRILDLLICPECQSPEQLKLKVHSEFKANSDRQNNAEVETGVLTCLTCERQYPIINGIPRMLPDNLISNLLSYHSDFFQEHSIKLPVPPGGIPLRGKSIADEIIQAKKRTLYSFSFQWNVFSEMYEVWEENFLDYVHPLQPDFFDGKLGLDAGCGFGRHLYYATKFGAEMVGLDLSEAVESAYNNTKQLPNVHIVQGDIYNPPFREGTFDFIYSIGVLHHLPDPQGGFTSLTRFLKTNATMFAWVYGPRYGISQKISVLLRRFTTKMDYRLLYAFCFSIAFFLRTFSHLPYKVMRKVPSLRGVAEKLPIKEHHKYPFRVVVADAFDRLSVPLVNYYTAEQFKKWFNDAGLVDVEIIERFKNNISWRGFGTKPEER